MRREMHKLAYARVLFCIAVIALTLQTEANSRRSKVSQVKADQRSLATAIESYYIDNNMYPCPRWVDGEPLLPSALTTPVSYISSVYTDPFKSRKNVGGWGDVLIRYGAPFGLAAVAFYILLGSAYLLIFRFAKKHLPNRTATGLLIVLPAVIAIWCSYLTGRWKDELRAEKWSLSDAIFGYDSLVPSSFTIRNSDYPGAKEFYYWRPIDSSSPEVEQSGWLVWSPGPDGVPQITVENANLVYDPRHIVPNPLLVNLTYDPTNGTTSAGDVWRAKQ